MMIILPLQCCTCIPIFRVLLFNYTSNGRRRKIETNTTSHSLHTHLNAKTLCNAEFRINNNRLCNGPSIYAFTPYYCCPSRHLPAGWPECQLFLVLTVTHNHPLSLPHFYTNSDFGLLTHRAELGTQDRTELNIMQLLVWQQAQVSALALMNTCTAKSIRLHTAQMHDDDEATTTREPEFIRLSPLHTLQMDTLFHPFHPVNPAITRTF